MVQAAMMDFFMVSFCEPGFEFFEGEPELASGDLRVGAGVGDPEVPVVGGAGRGGGS